MSCTEMKNYLLSRRKSTAFRLYCTRVNTQWRENRRIRRHPILHVSQTNSLPADRWLLSRVQSPQRQPAFSNTNACLHPVTEVSIRCFCSPIYSPKRQKEIFLVLMRKRGSLQLPRQPYYSPYPYVGLTNLTLSSLFRIVKYFIIRTSTWRLLSQYATFWRTILLSCSKIQRPSSMCDTICKTKHNSADQIRTQLCVCVCVCVCVCARLCQCVVRQVTTGVGLRGK
jgi:hypothetical protein